MKNTLFGNREWLKGAFVVTSDDVACHHQHMSTLAETVEAVEIQNGRGYGSR